MFTSKPHSISRSRAGQFRLQPLLARAIAGLVLVATAGGSGGCRTIYQQTRDVLPPEPMAELRMRVDDARNAESQAGQAGQKLHRDLKHALPGDVIQVDFDRLETAAFELERRVLSAREAQTRCGDTSELAGQIELLHRRAQAYQAYVQGSRQVAAATQARGLDALLRDPLFKP